MHIIKVISLFLIAFFAVCLQSCNMDNVSRSQNGLIFCVNSNVSILDPQSSEVNVTSATIAKNVFNRLVSYNQEKNQFKSEIATSWSISENRLVYTFRLSPKVTFHTTPWFTPTRSLNADDVVFSFQRLMNYSSKKSQNRAGAGEQTAVIDSEEQAFIDEIQHINYKYLLQLRKIVRKIKKIDDYTVSFILADSSANFLAILAAPNSVILSREYFESLSDNPRREEIFSNSIVGTGPYQLVSHKYNDYIKLKKNPHYWQDPEKPLLSRLIIDITPNQAKRMNKILTDECQIASQPSKTVMALHERLQKNYSYIESQNTESTVFYLNTSKAPLKNVELRRALAFAFNRDLYRKIIYGESGEPANSLFPFAMKLDENIDYIFSYNVTNAGNFIDRYKRIQKVTTVPTLTIWIEQSNTKLGYNSARIGQVIKRDLKKIGINCNIIEMSEKTIKNLLPYQGYDIIVSQQPFSRLLPMYRLYHNFSCSSRGRPTRTNYSSFCDKELSDLIGSILYAAMDDETNETYNRIQEKLIQNVPFIPIAYNSDAFIYHKDITNLVSLLVNGFDFSQTGFKEHDPEEQ